MSHEFNDGLQRVTLYKKGSEYMLYVGENFTRTYDEDSLPDEVKSKLTMAMAIDNKTITDEELMHYPTVIIYNRKSFYSNNDMDEIGWRVSESYYCLCLSNECINNMRGNDDSRR